MSYLPANYQESFVDGPVGRLRVWRRPGTQPDVPPVFFIHPINMQGLIWTDVVDRLPERDCVMLDMRSHGASDSVGPYGLEEWTDDCQAVFDAILPDAVAHVVGGSLGGPLSASLAARNPGRVRSIGLVGASLWFEGADVEEVLRVFDEHGVRGTFEQVFPNLTFAPGTPQSVIDRGLDLSNPNDVATVKQVWLATITSDARELAARVECPSIVITGEHDATCTPALGLEAARILGSVQTLLPGIGHLPMLESPELLADVLRAFLASVDSSVGSGG
ncbi:alpha/beta fold hydrolase [Desertimonas flava]|uniref:alpha/beta fold hydrolase n=1 Tax=Desertimonas flava TaxID=2064846 RepID=UPI000E350D55|nr:alpha/beta hydrolase [Desertimonas flava]